MSEERKSRLVKAMRYLVLAVFFLLALGLVSVSYTASLAVGLGVVLAWAVWGTILGVLLASAVRGTVLSIVRRVRNLEVVNKLILMLILVYSIFLMLSIFSWEDSAPPPEPLVSKYQATIEQLGPTTFMMQEEVLINPEFLIKEKEAILITLPKRQEEAKITSVGLTLIQLHITPPKVSLITTELYKRYSEPTKLNQTRFCYFDSCSISIVVLQDFPKGSFYQAKDSYDLNTSSYLDTETIRFFVRDLDRGITFAYLPAPYHHLRPFLIPFLEISSLSPWLLGLGGFITTLFINHIIKRILPRHAKSKGKEKTANRLTSPRFDLLTQATCAVLIDDKIIGTAWLVSNEGHLITAGHVLGEDKPLSQVQVQFEDTAPCPARPIQWGFQQAMGIDLAILQLDSPINNRQPLPISLAESVEGRCHLVGYGKTLSDRSQGVGEFVGVVDRQDSSANRLFRLRSPELAEEGYSGGAVFSEELGAVVAIQTETTKTRLGAGRDTVLAMPLYRVAHHWKPLRELKEGRSSLWVGGCHAEVR